MELAEWNERLSGQFAEVRRSRQARATELPLFALEHGLNQTEIQDLSTAIRAHVQHTPPTPKHELAWIVYAAEIGYRYSGDQYWQTFEAETPGWAITIISWPITHAILPRDLQQQLARILYEVRGSFSAELFESPKLLGDFIRSRSWKASSRFQNLAEEPALLGQLAVPLLLQGKVGTDTLIHPATLRRIG